MKEYKSQAKKGKYVFLSLSMIITLLPTSCTNQKETFTTSLVVEMRQNASINKPITFSEEISRIEYIPLELTADGSSMLADAMDISVTDEFVFVNSSKQGGIFQFSRTDGKFIRRFAPSGNGPGETQLVLNIYADEPERKIYIVQPQNRLEYTFDGEFVVAHEQKHAISLQYPVGNNRVAEMGARFVPFNAPQLIGMGVFSRSGETIVVKNDFARPDILPENASCLKDVHSALSRNSMLYFVSFNDTVFRLTDRSIDPAFVLNRQNSRESLEGALNPQDDSMFPNDFWVYDFFETPRSFYVRTIYNDKMHLFAYDKDSQTTTAEISEINPFEIFGYDRWMQGIGINLGDDKIPLWATKPYPDKKILVQYMPAPEFFYLKEQGIINQIPPEIGHIDEESNPIIVVYHLK